MLWLVVIAYQTIHYLNNARKSFMSHICIPVFQECYIQYLTYVYFLINEVMTFHCCLHVILFLHLCTSYIMHLREEWQYLKIVNAFTNNGIFALKQFLRNYVVATLTKEVLLCRIYQKATEFWLCSVHRRKQLYFYRKSRHISRNDSIKEKTNYQQTTCKYWIIQQHLIL